MKARLTRILAATVVVVAATIGIVVSQPAASQAATPSLQAIGLLTDGQRMLAWKTDNPGQNDWVRRVSGLMTDTSLIGLDFRVQDGQLYGAGNYGGIYRITLPPPGTSNPPVLTKVGQLGVALNGQSFGVDFNPAADRLRIVSNHGQNLSYDLNTNTTTAQTGLTDGATGATATGITGVAYTNNDLSNTTATLLFDIDTVKNQLSLQNPPANGTLFPIGQFGVDPSLNTGFDINTTLNTDKRAVGNTAFAVFVDPISLISTEYQIDLTSGFATRVDDFPLDVVEIAIAL
ncbi:hypothetical protein J2S43_003125 [Catenuloplanes nepalensis]|uniref:DUF4394 domain-containing protein n=1 Tax=Catenuloplanes nepalensis TaxID=587533 RepID=A0ABT9MTM5_9ACTN|nr:DUF4394 domain-containing protein [Catenuloplanes nepalensis]MDP9794613.1 hypothetical protein [Catenuloplanes nepalensis]